MSPPQSHQDIHSIGSMVDGGAEVGPSKIVTALSASSSSHRLNSAPVLSGDGIRGQDSHASLLESRASSISRPGTRRNRNSDTAVWNTLSIKNGSTGQRDEIRNNWTLLSELMDDDEEGNVSNDEIQPNQLVSSRSYGTFKAFFQSPAAPLSTRPWGIQSTFPSHNSLNGALSTSPPTLPEAAACKDTSERNGGYGMDTVLEAAASLESNASGRAETRPLIARTTSSNKMPQNRVTEAQQTHNWRDRFWPPSAATIAVAKCAIAYFIGSMFTFVPSLAKILITRTQEDSHGRIIPRPAYSAHMVATIVVYFHPSKSAGNMLLADRYAFILILFASLICILAMLTLNFFDSFSPDLGHKWDWISESGDWVVDFLFIGGSMGVLAWAKIWVANASFNSGCSMAAVVIYSVVIKEGNMPKLLELLMIVAFGVLISNIVCFTIFPTTANDRLQKSISRSLGSFSTLLDLLTSSFLLESHILKSNQPSLRQAIQDHSKAFKTLKADLTEAKHERVFDDRIRGRKLQLYDALIGSMARLAQHLSGMRGSTKLQESLIKASKEGKIRLNEESENLFSGINASRSIVNELQAAMGDEVDEEGINQSAKMFIDFRELAGTQMNILNDKCDDALEAVQALTRTSPETVDLGGMRQRLSDALKDFSKSSNIGIKRLHSGPKREKELYGLANENESREFPTLDEEEDGPNETVFMIYFFLFTFEEFARELLFLLDTVMEIIDAESSSVWNHVAHVLWGKDKKLPRRTFLYQQFQNLVPIDPSTLQPPMRRLQSQDKDRKANDVTQTSPYARARQQWWSFGEWLRRPEIRYSIKIWIGGAILAAPAYMEWSRAAFLEWRGEWALIAFFSVNNPTLGQTNAMSFYRCAGTFIGAMVGLLVYSSFPEDPILLPLAGSIFSIPCFYIVTQIPEHMQTGRFTILAYNLTCLYAYNSRERDYSVWKVAVYRSTTVMIGALWAALISRYWWPFTARKELRLGVSEFCLDLSYLYSQLVAIYSGHSKPRDSTENGTTPGPDGEDVISPLIPKSIESHPHIDIRIQHFLAMELHLQSQLVQLRDLLAQTKNEPRLKGPFPTAFYNDVLLSCERIVDRLHSMRSVTARNEWDQYIQQDFIGPINKQRREMAGSVILFLYTISAGFRLRTPMPPYLPPAELNRQRLVAAIRELDVVKRRSFKGGGRHLLYFAYASAMQEVISELDHLGKIMQDNFGVINQATAQDFENLFRSERAAQVLDIAVFGEA